MLFMTQYYMTRNPLGYRDADIAICDIYNTYNWNKIFEPTTDFDRDIIQHVAPQPMPMPKFLALIMPFHYFSWSCIAAGFLLTVLVLRIVSGVEEDIQASKQGPIAQDLSFSQNQN